MRTLLLELIVLAIGLGLIAPGRSCLAQTKAGPGSLTGVWKMEGLVSERNKIDATILQSGAALVVLARTNTAAPLSKIAEGSVMKNGEVTLTNTISMFSGYGKPGETFKLFVVDDSLENAKIRATQKSSFFICGSTHSPTNHVASDLAEIKKLTEQFSCSRWRSSDSSVSEIEEMVVHLLKDDERTGSHD